MTDTTLPGAGLSRRGLLKVGLFGSAFLATAGVTASLSGCSASVPASGLATLRSSDLPFLRALIPVVLEVAAAAGRLGTDDLGGCAFRSDIASMRHETQYTRLFRS